MPTQQNYNDLRFKVITANSNLINEQFQQVIQLVQSVNYSIADLVRVSINQIDFANQVIETGEPIVRATVQGNVEITPEDAPDILDGGLWSLVSLVVYAEFANEPTGQNITDANFIGAVMQYKVLVSEENERFVRSRNEQPEEEELLELPEEEDLELLPEEEPEEVDIMSDFSQTQKLTKEQLKKYQAMEKIKGKPQLLEYIFTTENKQTILDYIFEVVDPEIKNTKSQFPPSFIQNTFSIRDRIDMFRLRQIEDYDNLLESTAVINLIYKYVQTKKLTQGYIRIGENKAIQIEDSVFAKSELTYNAIDTYKIFTILAILFRSENKVNEFIEKSNLMISRQEIDEIYEQYINDIIEYFTTTYAELPLLPIVTVREELKVFDRFPRLYKAISDKIEEFYKIQLYEEKESYLEEINSGMYNFTFKGW